MKGLFCFLCVALVAIALVSLPSAASAAELPARVETSAVNPPAPVFDADAAGVKNFQVATVAALPGHPVERAANLVRGVRERRPLRSFLFRGRAGRCG